MSAIEEHQGGNLLGHLLSFGYLLREMGVAVSPGQMVELVGALEHVSVAQREDFKAALRCMLVLRREDLPLFEQAFEFFWRKASGADPAKELMEALIHKTKIPQRQLRLPSRKQAESETEQKPEEEQEEFEVQLTYSRDEALRKKDFAQFTWEEVQACKELLRRMRWRVEERRTRRTRPDHTGRRLDFRRTLRRSMRYGGEALDLAWRETKTEPRPLVVLCDISGSMERYSRILLQFAHAISTGVGEVESFVFGTRLTRITRQLRHRDIDDAIDAVSKHVIDWSGGTRIGDAIREFNFRWGRRVLGRGPVVLLISDGWETGDPEQLARELRALRRRCYRLIWLNPLSGRATYRPLVGGVRAAMAHVDDFLPIDNFQSLAAIERHLRALDARRVRV